MDTQEVKDLALGLIEQYKKDLDKKPLESRTKTQWTDEHITNMMCHVAMQFLYRANKALSREAKHKEASGDDFSKLQESILSSIERKKENIKNLSPSDSYRKRVEDQLSALQDLLWESVAIRPPKTTIVDETCGE